MPLIEVDRLTCRLDGTVALDDVTLTVDGPLVQGLVGPNGAGKTTLLRCMAGLSTPSSGRVAIDGRDATVIPRDELARRLAVLLQHPVAPVGQTVREAVTWGRLPHLGRLGRPGEADLRAVDGALARAGLQDVADRSITALSGGERQRAFIARALAQEPRVLLLDEPTAHLDLSHQIEVMEVLRTLAREGLTVIVALHDLLLAAEYCDRLALLHRGRVLAAGPADQTLGDAAVREAYGEVAVRRLRALLTGRGDPFGPPAN